MRTPTIRSIAGAVAVAAALAVAGCASGDEHAPAVTSAAAKATVERAAHVELAAAAVPADARDQGLETYFTNAGTVVHDKQVVALFVLEDAGVADDVADLVRSSAPKRSRLIVSGNVMVVYAPAGEDRGAAVAKAVEAL
jgi:hypothetical protein